MSPCTDDEILALARELTEVSVNVREYSVGTHLHLVVDKEGRVFDIYIVDVETGEFIATGRILN